jgi:hypothetical protein
MREMSGIALSDAPSEPVLTEDFLAEVDSALAGADADLALRYPGDPGTRQPVHTVYLSAADAHVDTPQRWGLAALDLLTAQAADGAAAAAVTGPGNTLDDAVYDRVLAKLAAQPVEDLRLDFEDGYGHRPDAEEDAAARSAANLLRDLLGATRYLATYAFYRSGLPAAATRLSNYLTQQASRVMDEPATALALAAFVVRGLHCGALDGAEVTAGTAVDRATLEALAQRRPLPTPSASPTDGDAPR